MIQTHQINIRDPFVLVHQGRYYLYGTRGPTCWGPADGFDVYTGTDLVSWEGPAACFQNDGTFWADRNYWAPEVHEWQGMFYLFASFKSETRRRGTAVLRSVSPLGPFEPWSDGPVTPADWECLDGTFYVSRSGAPFMVFCHEWVQAGDGEVQAVRLTEDLKAAAGAPFLLFRGSDAPWNRKMSHSSGMTGYVTDGPFLWRREDGSLICLWSGFSKDGYTQGMAVSDNGEIDGRFSQAAPLLTEDGGHGMLFRTLEGEIRLALHSPNTHLLERPRFIPVRLQESGTA